MKKVICGLIKHGYVGAFVVVGLYIMMIVIFVVFVIGFWALLCNHYVSFPTCLSVEGFHCFDFNKILFYS